MSPNTGECIVNSPIKLNCIFYYDQYDHFSQSLKNGVMKKKERDSGVYYSSVSKISYEYSTTYFPNIDVAWQLGLTLP